ncbi:MAG TPA: hypothetical protein VKY53_05885 [Marinobacter sp.]|nr:hypothetical protein [Marinobacter sp.]
MNKLTISALALLMTLGLAACSSEDEGPDFERAGDNAAEMLDDAGDSIEETYEEATGQDEGAWGEMKEGAEDAADAVGDAADETGDEIEESYEDATQ